MTTLDRPTTAEEHGELLSLIRQLGTDERQVFLVLARRIVARTEVDAKDIKR